ncbi:MAG: NADH-quinone oxidoreductase subunit NuoH [Verrucomicrobiales bacterium]|jgi:NADH-quinone oxidoreductase subunit H|nr:NADH-quinone oxidoreductase subunit NuoH [Verrucomicrobiales bacterium]|tara:strand:- start:8481 stop:9560 length:1080 start_codon:yes stop_codon:yes gene_type:complete
MDWYIILAATIKIVVFVFLVTLPLVAMSVWAERRVSAAIQDRVGPNRVGPAGLLQPVADGIKFLLKEDFTPNHVRKTYYWLAPALTMIPSLLTCAVIPFGSKLFGEKMVIADLDVGPLFVFAVASLTVYGIVLAGWASNSKYPFLGSVRSTSQMISYEISLGLSIVPLLMIYGELNLGHIVMEQAQNGWALLPLWGDGLSIKGWLLSIPLFISFVVFTTSMFAETNRLPFDLPECETELVAGYHTEYSSMKFALFFLGEYAAMIIGSGLAVTLFFGGWSLPFGWLTPESVDAEVPFWHGLIHLGAFFAKVILFILFFIAVRWTLPRFRYDQLMRLGWVVFFELALANVILTALLLMWLK